MEIILYNNYSNNNVVRKNIVAVSTLNGDIKEDTNMHNPRIIINKPANLTNCNYCYISAFARYYYITSVEVLSGGRVALNCSVDVLMSFYDDFKVSQVIAKRSTSHPNLYIQDEAVTHLPQPIYLYRKLNFAFTPSASGNKYLLRIGG